MDQFEKALACKTFAPLRHELFEKGKKAEIGEVREWKGQKMRKTSNGWVPAGESKQKTPQDQETSESTSEPKDLATLARAASDSALKAAAQGANEEVRIAAKKELERRKTEGSDAFEAPKEVGLQQTSDKETPKTSESQTSISKKDVEGIQDWIGDDYTPEMIDSIYVQLEDLDIVNDLDVRKGGKRLFGSPDAYAKEANKVIGNILNTQLYISELEDKGLKEQDIRNILWGMVQFYSLGRN